MPIYVYRCRDCEQEMEVLQKMSDPHITHCEACHQESLERCVTSPRFRLKGGGYYETDEKPKSQQRHIASSDSSSAGETTTTTSN